MRAWLHRAWVVFAAGGTIAVVVSSIPGRAGAVAASAAILGGTAVVAAIAARAVRRALPADPSAFDVPRSRRRPPDPWRLPDLLRIERLLASSQAGALDLHHRLRPRLRELAESQLAERGGISIEAQPERARAALGETAWGLLRPDRPEPSDRGGPGATLEEIRALVEALEAL